MKTALITGITGQDGAYLSQLLIEKGYCVIGTTRNKKTIKFSKLSYLGLSKKIIIEQCNLLDSSSVINLIKKFNPSEIYNLAAQSSVGHSFKDPIGTINFNTSSVLNLLEAIHITNPYIRFYQASSSEMYGKINNLPITECSLFNPISPYGVSKANAHLIVSYYRNTLKLFASTGVLFNHESFLRDDSFFIKKVIRQSIELANGKHQYLLVGNIDVKRDFGYAKPYTEAMWLILQNKQPDDFIICSGISISLREIIYYIFNKLHISIDKLRIDEGLYRPNEILDIYGDNTKARRELGWSYEMSFYDVIDILLEEEMASYIN